MDTKSQRFYRLDTFRNVPASGRDEFLRRVGMTHELLRAQEGFVRDYLLEQPGEGDTSTIVTLAEWESKDVVARVAEAVKALHEREQFSPHELISRLGIKAEFGQYEPAV